jgi:hypothetical protein
MDFFRWLQALNQTQLPHNDLSLADLFWDERKYLMIARSAPTSKPRKIGGFQNMRADSIGAEKQPLIGFDILIWDFDRLDVDDCQTCEKKSSEDQHLLKKWPDYWNG